MVLFPLLTSQDAYCFAATFSPAPFPLPLPPLPTLPTLLAVPGREVAGVELADVVAAGVGDDDEPACR